MFDGLAAGLYSWTLRQTIRFRAVTMAVSARAARRRRCTCSRSCPKGFIPSVDTGQISGQIEAIQGIGFESMVGAPAQMMDDPRRATRTSPRSPSNVGGNGGRLNIDLKPRDQRTLTRGPDHRRAAAEAVARAGRAGVPDEPAGDSHRRRSSRAASTSSRCRIPTPTSCIAWRRSSRRRLHDVPGIAGRQLRPADQERRSSPSISTANRSPRSA